MLDRVLLDRSAFQPQASSYRNFVIDSSHDGVKRTATWQKAVVIVGLAVLIVGIVGIILTATVGMPAAATTVLLILGQRCFELGLISLTVAGISCLVNQIYTKQKPSEVESTPQKSSRRIQVIPDSQDPVKEEGINEEVLKLIKR